MADAWLERAATGHLPPWTEATPARREHMGRVAQVMENWARRAGLDDRERVRWKAAGWLHDTLRDAPADHLRRWVGPPFDALPVSFWHGPATAERLSAEGAADEDVLDAIRYHTLGRAGLARIGKALIAADYLEPGRADPNGWRAALRERAPAELEAVLCDVVRSKLERGLARTHPIRVEMVELWNSLTRQAEQDA